MRLPVAVAAALVGALLVSTQARQQDPLTFRSRVDLVQLDVVVVNQDGRPIEGLKKENFTLRERGGPRPIDAVREVSLKRSSGLVLPTTARHDVSSNASATADQIVVLVIDDFHLVSAKQEGVKTIARRIVNEIAPDAPVSILTTSGRLAVELTNDHLLILDAINSFVDKVDAGMPEPRPQLAIKGLPVVESPGMALARSMPGRGIWLSDTQPPPDMARFFGALSQCKLLETAGAMLTTARAQRKAVAWITGGIPVLTGPSIALTPIVVSPTAPTLDPSATMIRPERPCVGEPGPSGLCDLPAVLKALGQANVSTYVFDTGGAAGTTMLMPGCTGGLTAAPDQLDFGIERLIADLDHYYVLGFSSGELGDGKYRPVNVSVDVPGAIVRFRSGYTPVPARSSAGPPASRLVDLSADALPVTDVPMRLNAVPMPLATGGARVILALEVTADDRVLGSDGTMRDALDYKVLAADLKKKKIVAETPGRRTEFVRRPARARDGVTDLTTVQILTSLDLAPGAYQLRASATSDAMSTGGSVYQTLLIPDFASAPLAIGGLLIGYDGDSRVPNVDATQLKATLPFQPTLDREFMSGDTLRVLCPVFHRSGVAGAVVTLAIVDSNDRVIRRVDQPIAAGAIAASLLTLPLKDIAAGAYRLRGTVIEGKTAAAREIGVVIR